MNGDGLTTPKPSTNGAMRVYGSRISYYTGKFEAYLRYRGLAYDVLPLVGNQKRLIAGTGVSQMPVIEMADGRWMTDTTPMIAWLEGFQTTGRSIYPDDPALRFAGLLIEDYADEWLWRSAMHYRWTYRVDRQYAAETLYEEQFRGQVRYPRWLGLAILKVRQRGGFVRSDGVDAQSRAHADQTYLNALAGMEAILAERPFLLGARPTIADFGMMAPMFRHFGMDPTPARIMRERAPRVFEWTARVWNLPAGKAEGELITAFDAPLTAFLAEMCETHLAQLRQNAAAFGAQAKRYRLEVQGAVYASVPTSRYRVWCLEQLRKAWAGLPTDAKAQLQSALSSPEAAILWDERPIAPSHYDTKGEAPFNRAINVYDGGIPPWRLF